MPMYTAFKKPPRKNSPSGTEFIKTYQEEINKKGERTLVVTGQTNVYEMIQADLEASKIENILHAVAMGDINALQQREATYADATTMPHNLMEFQNLVIKAKDEFYKMPVEVRKEFDNSPDKYVTMMGTKEFLDIMAPYNEKMYNIAKEKNHAEYLEKVKEQARFNTDVAAEIETLKGGKAE